MAGGDGGVLAHEHHARRLAHHQAPADDHGVLALAVNAVVVQNLHAGGGGAGGVAQVVEALEHAGIGQVGHAVHVLLGVQAVADFVLVGLQVLGQGTEHEHAMDGIVGVDLVDGLKQLFLGNISGKQEVDHLHTHQLSPLGSAPLVAQVAGVLAAADDGQSGLHALLPQSSGALLQVSIQGIGNFLAQQ